MIEAIHKAIADSLTGDDAPALTVTAAGNLVRVAMRYASDAALSKRASDDAAAVATLPGWRVLESCADYAAVPGVPINASPVVVSTVLAPAPRAQNTDPKPRR